MTLNRFPERFFTFSTSDGSLRIYDSNAKSLKYVYHFKSQKYFVYVDDRLRRGDARQDIREGLPRGYDWPFALLFGQTPWQLEVMLFWVRTESEFEKWTRAFKETL